MLRQIARQLIIPLMRRLLRWIYSLRSRKYVLLACNGSLMADYLADVLEILQGDTRLAFHVLLPPHEERPGEHNYIRQRLPVPVVGPRWAKVMPWSLIIAADHCWREWVDCKWYPTIFTNHGIDSRKLSNGEPYQYGSGALAEDECRPRYSRMFSVSEAERILGAKQNPVIRDTIVVTGSLMADRMMAMQPQRGEIRRRRGLRPEETVVLVMSTWGPNCLYHRMGDMIVEQALRLRGKLSFIFTMHPNEHRALSPSERNWGEHMKTFRQYGFVVLDANEEIESSIVACDVILTDHTSAAFYGAILGKPLVYVPCFAGCVDEGSIIWRLQSMSPRIRQDATDLHERVLEAKYNYPFDNLAEIALDLNSFPGHAAARIREEVYSLLNLPICR